MKFDSTTPISALIDWLAINPEDKDVLSQCYSIQIIDDLLVVNSPASLYESVRNIAIAGLRDCDFIQSLRLEEDGVERITFTRATAEQMRMEKRSKTS